MSSNRADSRSMAIDAFRVGRLYHAPRRLNCVSGELRWPKTNTAGLELLREEIDRIDGELHGLLRESARHREAWIGLAKCAAGGDTTASSGLGREAQVMRGLERTPYEGALPGSVVIRIWREIMSAAIFLMQQPSAASPCAGTFDLALGPGSQPLRCADAYPVVWQCAARAAGSQRRRGRDRRTAVAGI